MYELLVSMLTVARMAGQENTSDLCEVGDVPNILESDPSDHFGPYDGVKMGC